MVSGRAVALPVGETTVLRLANPCSGVVAVAISVTPLDACHCLVRDVVTAAVGCRAQLAQPCRPWSRVNGCLAATAS